jgi:GTP cyclohydrolase IA
MAVDRTAAARAIADFLRALGHAPDSDPELAQTAERVVEAYADDLLSGYAVDLPAMLAKGSMPAARDAAHGIVVIHEIAIATVCPHHLLPSLGSATVAYLPGSRLLGLGTLAGLVDAYARRLALQERIGQNVVRALIDHAGARGAYCRISLVHGCLSARGARQSQARVRTTAAAGELAEPAGASALALALSDETDK